MPTQLRVKTDKDGKIISSGKVFRMTVEPFDYHGKKIIVGLEPGDIISFREERSRKTYTLPIPWAYRQAVKMSAEKEQGEKRTTRLVNRGILR